MFQELGLLSTIVIVISGGSQHDVDGAIDAFNTLRSVSSSPTSISHKAKQGIFEFPFIISSNSVDLKEVVTIMKSGEIEYGNMVLISVGINPMASNVNGVSITRALSNFHTNSESAIDADYELSTIDDIVQEGGSSNTSYSIGNNLQAALPPPVTPPTPPSPAIKYGEVAHDDLSNAPIVVNKINTEYHSKFNMTIIEIKLRLGADEKSHIAIPIGIKAVPHWSNASEMCQILASYIKSRTASGLVRFLQWRSGERKGFLNFLFRLDDIKADIDFVKRVGSENSSWANILKQRANNRKIGLLAKLFGMASGNNALSKLPEMMPNCSFMLTLEDVDTIEQITSVNIFTNPSAASKLLEDAMGLGLFIIDSTTGVVHIMYASYKKFMPYPISHLKGGKSAADGDMTKLLIDIMKKT
jgi:hypothetical protein